MTLSHVLLACPGTSSGLPGPAQREEEGENWVEVEWGEWVGLGNFFLFSKLKKELADLTLSLDESYKESIPEVVRALQKVWWICQKQWEIFILFFTIFVLVAYNILSLNSLCMYVVESIFWRLPLFIGNRANPNVLLLRGADCHVPWIHMTSNMTDHTQSVPGVT